MKSHTVTETLLLTGLIALSGCKTSTSAPETKQNLAVIVPASPQPHTIATTFQKEIGDPFGIWDDTTKFCTVSDKGLSLPVRRGKEGVITGDKSGEFYVAPRISVSVEELRKAFASKALVQKAATGDDDNVYRMSMSVALIDDELQKAASAQAAAVKHVEAPPEAFHLYPYTYLEIYWVVNDTEDPIKKLIYKTPLIDLGKRDVLQETVPLTVEGTENELAALINRGSIVGVYQGAGFKVEQNIVDASVQALSKQNFFQDLHGDAVWNDLESYSRQGGGGQINLPFFSAAGQSSSGFSKTERSSFVTRNQMLKIAEKYVAKINYGEWTEMQGLGQQDLTALRQQVVNSILACADRIEFELNPKNATLVRSEKLLADLAPDHIAKLDAELKNKFNVKKTASASSKIASSNTFDLLLDDDCHFAGDGTATVPKSVTLYQINNAFIDRLNEMSFKATVVTGSVSGTLTLASTFGEVVTSKPIRKFLKGHFDVKKSEQIAGGDRDVHTKDGRNTFIVVWHGDPRVEDGRITLPVYCVVKEGHENWTTLRMKETVRIKKPVDFLDFDLEDTKMFTAPGKKNAFFLNSFAPAYHDTWSWEIHDYRSLDMPVNSLLHDVHVKPDSHDDDDTLPNRMGFRGDVLIPYLSGANPVWHFSPRAGLNLVGNKEINDGRVP